MFISMGANTVKVGAIAKMMDANAILPLYFPPTLLQNPIISSKLCFSGNWVVIKDNDSV